MVFRRVGLRVRGNNSSRGRRFSQSTIRQETPVPDPHSPWIATLSLTARLDWDLNINPGDKQTAFLSQMDSLNRTILQN